MRGRMACARFMRDGADASSVSPEPVVGETTPETKPAEQQTAASQAEQPKALSADESAKVLAALKKANDEAKGYREQLDAAAKAKADAERAKAESEGKWKELYEAERKRADEFVGKAAQADDHAKELDTLKSLELAALPEDVRADLTDLPPSKAIALARKWQAATTTAKAAPAVNGGAPAASKAPLDLSRANPAQAREAMRADPKLAEQILNKVFGNARDVFG